jgi:hypothetical protein
MKLASFGIAAGLTVMTASQATAHERWFDMVNDSNRTIVAVRASHIDRPLFGRYNLLYEFVPPGYQLRIEPLRRETQGYCRFDIEIQFDNGDRQDIWDVDLCKATQVVTYGYRRTGFLNNVVY